MDMMLFTNIVLIVLCIFTMLLVWSRNWNASRRILRKSKAIRKTSNGLGKSDRSGMEGFEVVSDRFGLPMLQAKQLIDFIKQSALIDDLTIELD